MRLIVRFLMLIIAEAMTPALTAIARRRIALDNFFLTCYFYLAFNKSHNKRHRYLFSLIGNPVEFGDEPIAVSPGAGP